MNLTDTLIKFKEEFLEKGINRPNTIFSDLMCKYDNICDGISGFITKHNAKFPPMIHRNSAKEFEICNKLLDLCIKMSKLDIYE